MPDIEIQFHATADEIMEFVRDAVKMEGVHLAALKFQPFIAKELKPSEIASAVSDPSIHRFCFSVEPPDLNLKYQGDFDKRHSDQLVLYVGRLTSAGLGQSWLTCRTDNLETIKVWRKIAKSLKKRTEAGVTSINRENGMSSFDTSFRYSDGAKRLESQGVAILPIQAPNGPIFRLGDIRGN